MEPWPQRGGNDQCMLVKGEKIFLFDAWDEEAEEICE
jgi:hypothetical protein